MKNKFLFNISSIILLSCFSNIHEINLCVDKLSSCVDKLPTIHLLNSSTGYLSRNQSLDFISDVDNLVISNIESLSNIRQNKCSKYQEVFVESHSSSGNFIVSDSKSCEKIYLYKNNAGEQYYSRLSLDTAKKASGIDNEALVSLLLGNSISSIQPIQIMPIISGTLQWRDIDGNTYPLYNSTVNVILGNGNTYFGSTDENGFYKIACNLSDKTSVASYDFQIKVQLTSSNVVMKDSNKTIYSIYIDKSFFSGTTDMNKNVSAIILPQYSDGTDCDFGQAVHIFEALSYYAKHAKSICGSNISSCDVIYPCDETDTLTNMYRTSNNTIYISNSEQNNVARKAYMSFDPIGHEYGHHLENVFNFGEFVSEEHYTQYDDSDYLYANVEKYKSNAALAKENGAKLAWTEAWPTFWATIAQQSFPEDLKAQDKFSVGDAVYYAGNYNESQKDILNYEGRMTDTVGGEGSELAIIRYLYNIWDEVNEKSERDDISLNEKQMWKSLISYKPIYVYEYYESLQKDYSKLDFGLLNEDFCFGGYNFTIDSTDTTKFTWNINSKVSLNRSNYFNLKIYDEYKSYVFSTASYSNVKNIKLNNSEVNTIKKLGKAYVSLSSKSVNCGLVTGIFLSKLVEVNY